MPKNITLESGSYGPRAVLRSAWHPSMIGLLNANHVAELELNAAKGWRGADLSFLAELTELKSFKIIDFHIKDISPVHLLPDLRQLDVSTYCATELQFSAFQRLESCGLEWRSKAKSIFDCTTLKSLFINKYKGKDVRSFAKLTNLESLALLNAPIENIREVSGLKKLRSLRLGLLRCLSSLTGLESLENLEELDINTCRGFQSIEEIGALTCLKKLCLNNLGAIESLKPLDRLDGLELISFYESTNILDGDLSPLLRQKFLSRTAFQNRRHYSLRREDLRAYAGV